MEDETQDGAYDVAVVGGGIVGLAHAYAAARLGARVVLLERGSRLTSASIQNFGFVTVTGQERSEMWPLARRSRDIWASLAPRAGVAIEQSGMVMLARRPEAAAVLEAFMATEMGEGCRLLGARDVKRRYPDIPFVACGALVSPHELRVEPRKAVPALATWLRDRYGVTIRMCVEVQDIEPGVVLTNAGKFRAGQIFVCPGDNVLSMFPGLAREMGVSKCKLQMLRLAAPGYRLPSALMSDLGLVRYEGYSALEPAGCLRRRLGEEQGELLEAGVHLIVVQSADGSLVVGDSHEYADAPDPFQCDQVDKLILSEFRNILGAPPPVIERWVGVYAWSAAHNWFSREVCDGVRVTVVTSGAGMSTAFAIGEDVVCAAMKSQIREVV